MMQGIKKDFILENKGRENLLIPLQQRKVQKQESSKEKDKNTDKGKMNIIKEYASSHTKMQCLKWSIKKKPSTLNMHVLFNLRI